MNLIVVLVVAALATVSESRYGPRGGYTIFSRTNGVFAVRYYESLRNRTGNLLLCPLGLNYALTALAYGTRNDALRQLRKAMEQRGYNHETLNWYKAFTDFLKNDKRASQTTELFTNDISLKEDFLKELQTYFDFEVNNVNFMKNYHDARDFINEFVDKKTNHQVPALLQQGEVSTSTSGILLNFINFQSNWALPFNPNNTRRGRFYGTERDSVSLLMKRTMLVDYKDDRVLRAQFLKLFYEGGDYSFNIILPYLPDGLNDLEDSIRYFAFQHRISSPYITLIHNGLMKELVTVYLPKFEISNTLRLNDQLEQMGIKDIFLQSKDNFQKLSSTDFFLDKIIQINSFSINVNGTGEVENSATVPEDDSQNVTKSSKFIANHPFLFIIEHVPSSTVMFVGRVTEI